MELSDCKATAASIDVLTQLRRRESDARWRANLANCYETLKNIIPINKRASKKQISKAYILESTSKHLSFLEKLLVALLEHDATTKGVEPDLIADWVAAAGKDIKDEFLEYYIPYIQAEVPLRKYKRKKSEVFLPAEVPVRKTSHKNKPTKTVTTRKRTPKRRVVKFVRLNKTFSANQMASLTNQGLNAAELDMNRAVMFEVSKRSDQVIIKQPLLDVGGKHIIKVFKVNKETLCKVLNVDLNDYFGTKTETDDLQCVPEDNEFSTEIIASNFPDLDLLTIDPDALAEVLGPAILCTPEKPEIAESAKSAEKEDKSLLCNEWMWQSDDEEQSHEGGTSPDDFMRRGKDMSARQKKQRTGQKCRRSLNSIFTASEADEIIDFDGYLAFYQRERAIIEASGVEDADISSIIRQKWCSLSETERSTFMHEAKSSCVASSLPVPEQDVIETWEEFESDFGQLPIPDTFQPELSDCQCSSFQQVPSLSPHMSQGMPKNFMSNEEDQLMDMLVPSIERFTESHGDFGGDEATV
ncbi:hypothetical protein CAPTEDRAFT_228277 [Capitella teleta]|uniref:BHLH domain-containing protein n=1 Tax=Capitella teleta TaxID=283909 RepID=R7UXL0_CAPTE|nr:hypothetical protein CAPTEDRAFT_228277 [Capitella teleta]|eukprot:ELU08657.1 hypothetical protein CAPTEDRAFT_228277 [Capitella teleta]